MLRRTTLTLAVAALAVAAAWHTVHADDPQHTRDTSDRGRSDNRVQIGFDVAPVPLDLEGKDRALVGLGSYIVNAAAACNDCHTYPNYAQDGDPFKGEQEKINTAQYMTGGRIFGDIVSPNITPKGGQPAGFSYEQFESLMRTGRDPDEPDNILQVMPWPAYGKLTRRELRAIYEYLSAIPSLPDNPHPTE